MCRTYGLRADDRWNSADPTTRARARGAAITAALYRNLAAAQPTGSSMTPLNLRSNRPARIAAGDREMWAFCIDPSGGWNEPIHRERPA